MVLVVVAGVAYTVGRNCSLVRCWNAFESLVVRTQELLLCYTDIIVIIVVAFCSHERLMYVCVHGAV